MICIFRQEMESAIVEIAVFRIIKYYENDPSKQQRFSQHSFYFFSPLMQLLILIASHCCCVFIKNLCSLNVTAEGMTTTLVRHVILKKFLTYVDFIFLNCKMEVLNYIVFENLSIWKS